MLKINFYDFKVSEILLKFVEYDSRVLWKQTIQDASFLHLVTIVFDRIGERCAIKAIFDMNICTHL